MVAATLPCGMDTARGNAQRLFSWFAERLVIIVFAFFMSSAAKLSLRHRNE
ncbi:hypothetical protein [Grimontia hollisae]|uniref:hypothetical protein n=1 Tax=Grimontia hollisae TaxID=673 RepID=UPI001E4F32BE|nr:hypothetical protein [Grimontia hollisae]